jgi:ribosomal protein S2
MQMEAIQANKNALTSCMKSGILTNTKHVKNKNTPTEKEKKRRTSSFELYTHATCLTLFETSKGEYCLVQMTLSSIRTLLLASPK